MTPYILNCPLVNIQHRDQIKIFEIVSLLMEYQMIVQFLFGRVKHVFRSILPTITLVVTIQTVKTAEKKTGSSCLNSMRS